MSKIIKFEEGFRSKPYYDTEGYMTIGYGTKLSKVKYSPPLDHIVLNLTEETAEALLDQEIERINEEFLLREFDWTKVGEYRWDILESMCYQLGISGFKKFKKMIAAIHQEDWPEAAFQALDSLWATQTPERAHRHARVIREGDFRAYGGIL